MMTDQRQQDKGQNGRSTVGRLAKCAKDVSRPAAMDIITS